MQLGCSFWSPCTKAEKTCQHINLTSVYYVAFHFYYIDTTSLSLLLLSRAVAAVAFCLVQILAATNKHHLCVKAGQTTFRPLSIATRSAAAFAKAPALQLPSAASQHVNNGKEWTPTAPHGAWWCRKMVRGVYNLHHADGKLILPGQHHSQHFNKSHPAAACAEQEAMTSTSGSLQEVYTAPQAIQVSL
jgi:hypothetical protein